MIFSTIPLDVKRGWTYGLYYGRWFLETIGMECKILVMGGEWKEHLIAEAVFNIETTRSCDIDKRWNYRNNPNTAHDSLVNFIELQVDNNKKEQESSVSTPFPRPTRDMGWALVI